MAKLTRSQYLQDILDKITVDAQDGVEHQQWFVEYRNFDGWYVVPIKIRWFGDDGEFLGRNWRVAERNLKTFF